MTEHASSDETLDEIEKYMVRLTDEFNKVMDKNIAQGRFQEVSCRSCTHAVPGCCQQKLVVSFMEVLPIARWIIGQGMDTPEFRERLKQEGDIMEAADREEWLQEQHACIFLKEGRCSIYPIRPVACGTYWVVTPKEQCQPGQPNVRIAHIDNNQPLAFLLQRAHQLHNLMGLHESELRIYMGALPRLLWIALEAWNLDDPKYFIKRQLWPSADNLEEGWVDGTNPFRGLVQIRRREK